VSRLALSAIGRDRPGIVARVTEVLLRHGVNVEDSQMGILGGHFTMTLILAPPSDLSREVLAGDLEEAAASLGLEALVLRDVESLPGESTEPTHLVTVYGVDHPGIVHSAARLLAEREVNITDLNTRLIEEEGAQPLYALLVEVALPAEADPSDLEDALRALGRQEDVDVSIRSIEVDEL
jgi:glycine cleavage system transcriptional repressor